jgi:hypothetical protein
MQTPVPQKQNKTKKETNDVRETGYTEYPHVED